MFCIWTEPGGIRIYAIESNLAIHRAGGLPVFKKEPTRHQYAVSRRGFFLPLAEAGNE